MLDSWIQKQFKMCCNRPLFLIPVERMKTPRHILQKIEANRTRREPILDLRSQALLAIPPEIHASTHLQQLLLRNNAIQRLPEWLKDLPNLQFIELNINPLQDLGSIQGLVLDWGVWRRLQPKPSAAGNRATAKPLSA